MNQDTNENKAAKEQLYSPFNSLYCWSLDANLSADETMKKYFRWTKCSGKTRL